jgi:hypothetical protein
VFVGDRPSSKSVSASRSSVKTVSDGRCLDESVPECSGSHP